VERKCLADPELLQQIYKRTRLCVVTTTQDYGSESGTIMRVGIVELTLEQCESTNNVQEACPIKRVKLQFPEFEEWYPPQLRHIIIRGFFGTHAYDEGC
jgi:hypothetical protein